jgi:hypothetical protein
METEEMMARLQAEIRTDQEHMKQDFLTKMEAKVVEMKAQTTSLTSRIEATHKKLMAAI